MVVWCCAVVGCGGGAERRVDVFAASSLADVFAVVERALEAEHDDLDVVVSTAGSSTLAAQIEGGAPADVFAAADLRTMQRVVDAGLVPRGPFAFARNRLTIAVEPGNPLGIAGPADLARDDVTLVLAAPDVPVGRYAARTLELAGVAVEPASYEQSVSSVASKVALGEADAGIVYVTDVLARTADLDAVEIPAEHQIDIVYPIAVLADADDAASLVVDAVLGEIGRGALGAAGFELP